MKRTSEFDNEAKAICIVNRGCGGYYGILTCLDRGQDEVLASRQWN